MSKETGRDENGNVSIRHLLYRGKKIDGRRDHSAIMHSVYYGESRSTLDPQHDIPTSVLSYRTHHVHDTLRSSSAAKTFKPNYFEHAMQASCRHDEFDARFHEQALHANL